MQATPRPPATSWLRQFLALPRTPLGRGAMALIGLHVVTMILHRAIAPLTGGGGQRFFDNPWMSATLLIAGAFAVVGGVVAAVAVVARGERSIVAVLAILYGIFVLAFGLGEVLSPH